MNEKLSQMLVEQLRAVSTDVDVFLALEALARANPAVACGAVAAFNPSAPPHLAPTADRALLVLAKRDPEQMMALTQNGDVAVAGAAREALMYCPANCALPLYLRLVQSRSGDEACTGLELLGKISSPEVRAPLLKALGHRSATVRACAANVIRYRADEHWVAELLEAIRRLRREETDKRKDFDAAIVALCSTVVEKSTSAHFDLLIQGLEDADARVRRTCASALGRLGDRAAVLPLIETLEHPRRGKPWQMQLELVNVLVQLGDARAIAPLQRAGVALSAEALCRLKGREAVPELVAALEQATLPREIRDLAELLAQFEGPGEQQWPRAWLRSASLPVLQAAALQLVHTAPDEAAQHLCDMLPHLPAGKAVDVARALAAMGRPEGFESLAQALADDPHHWNVEAVTRACQSLRGPQVQALLLGLLPRIRENYVRHVWEALAAQGADVLPALINAGLQAANRKVGGRYVSALAGFCDPKGAELLAPLMVRDNPLREGAQVSLALTPRPEVCAALAAALPQAETPADAQLILETLACAATREAIPDLLRGLRDDVASEAILAALGKLADPVAVPAVVEQLASSDPLRRQAAAAALEEIADAAASEPLFRLLLTETDLYAAQTAMDAWLALSRTDGDVGKEARDGLGVPGTRAFLLASIQQLDSQR